ncbi:MAG: carbon storage regulator CsrA [Pseudomonadales bacterium]
MVIVSRDTGQSIVIGDDIKVTVLEIGGGRVRMSVETPAGVEVHRQEIYQRIARGPAQTDSSRSI